MESANRILTCRNCGTINEITSLEARPITKVVIGNGYTCSECGKWEHCYYLNTILQDKLRALVKLKRGSPKYIRALVKFRQRFDNLQREMVAVHGLRSHPDLAVN